MLFGVALLARHWGSVLQAGLSIASIIYGSLLGVFLLGLADEARAGKCRDVRHGRPGSAMMLYMQFVRTIAFTWYVVIGTYRDFRTGVAASFLTERNI